MAEVLFKTMFSDILKGYLEEVLDRLLEIEVMAGFARPRLKNQLVLYNMFAVSVSTTRCPIIVSPTVFEPPVEV